MSRLHLCTFGCIPEKVFDWDVFTNSLFQRLHKHAVVITDSFEGLLGTVAIDINGKGVNKCT